MSMRERRSLWGSISMSRKVNRLSLAAALLYTWAIPHFDDEGFQEGDPETIKARIVPLRSEMPVSKIPQLTEEIVAQGLWILHRIKPENRCEEIYIQDPVFERRQSFRNIHKVPSDIKQLIDKHQDRCLKTSGMMSSDIMPDAKRSEEKGSEVKGSEGKANESPTRCTPENLMLLFNETTQYLPKVTQLGKTRRDKIKTRIQEGKNQLDWWRTVFKKADVVLLPGRNGKKDWFPTFDWLIENDRNAVKVFEDHYADAKRPPPQFSPQPGMDAWLKRKLEEEGQ